MNKLLLPPFGKTLQIMLQQRKYPKNDVFLFLGANAWQQANYFRCYQTILVLPIDVDPEHYCWPVAGLSVLAIDTSDPKADMTEQLDKSYIRKLAYLLLKAGALIVRVILSTKALVVYRRDAA